MTRTRFYNFGRFISEHGLLAQYLATPEFNHTPLTGWFCALILRHRARRRLQFAAALAGNRRGLFRGRAVLLRWRETDRQPPWWALALLALSPVNFMVSGFHGNVDSVLAWLLLLAARECERGRAVWCGLFFGLACQVKIIPLLLAPAFFFFWLHRGRGRAFFLTATAQDSPRCGPCRSMVCRGTFLTRSLGYSSNWGSWGVTWLLRIPRGGPRWRRVGFQNLTTVQVVCFRLEGVVVADGAGFAWRRARLPGVRIAAHAHAHLGGVFCLRRRRGGQYLVWFAPFFWWIQRGGMRSLRWPARCFCLRSTRRFGRSPLVSRRVDRELLPQWVAWTVLPWLTVAAYLLSTLGKKRGPSPNPVGAAA